MYIYLKKKKAVKKIIVNKVKDKIIKKKRKIQILTLQKSFY